MIVYVDTSAAMKLVIEEGESATLAEHLEKGRADRGDRLVSSLLLHTELHCAAGRRAGQIDPRAVTDVLSAISLIDVERSDLLTAPLLPGHLRSSDAIHLATALRAGADEMVVYDVELGAAAQTAGIEVARPG